MSEQATSVGTLLDRVIEQAAREGVTLEELRFGQDHSLHFRFVGGDWAFEYAMSTRDLRDPDRAERLAGYICWRAKHRLAERSE